MLFLTLFLIFLLDKHTFIGGEIRPWMYFSLSIILTDRPIVFFPIKIMNILYYLLVICVSLFPFHINTNVIIIEIYADIILFVSLTIIYLWS